MIPVTLVRKDEGTFGGDNYHYADPDGNEIIVLVCWGLLQPCEAVIRVPHRKIEIVSRGECETCTKEYMLELAGYVETFFVGTLRETGNDSIQT